LQPATGVAACAFSAYWTQANCAGVRIWVNQNNSRSIAFLIDHTGLVRFPLYTVAGLLQCDASGTIKQNSAANPSTTALFIGSGAPGTAASELDIQSSNTGVGKPFRVASGNGDILAVTYSGINIGGGIAPVTDNAWDIGTSALRMRTIYAAGGVVTSSDERMKEDIAPLTVGLDFIEQLKPVSFRWKLPPEKHTADEPGDTRWGLIAQDVDQLPEADGTGLLVHDHETDIYGLTYDQLIAPLILAVQELAAQVRELQSRRPGGGLNRAVGRFR
jgi:hypothetical protein